MNGEHRNGLLLSHGEAQASPGKFDFVNGHYAKVIDGGGDLTSVATCDSDVLTGDAKEPPGVRRFDLRDGKRLCGVLLFVVAGGEGRASFG